MVMANRIRDVRKSKHMTLDELSEASGISSSFLSRIESGERGLSLENAVRLARVLRCDIPDLTSEFSDEDIVAASKMELGSKAAPEGDIENLTIHSGAGGGGALSVEVGDDGFVADPAMTDGFWSFPTSIKAGWRHLDRIKAMPVTGDSMEPTLAKGSTVFVDTTHTFPNPEDIYAIDQGDGLVIKRLKLVPRSDKILIISDNRERYGEPDELRREDVRVYGRVVAWFQWRG